MGRFFESKGRVVGSLVSPSGWDPNFWRLIHVEGIGTSTVGCLKKISANVLGDLQGRFRFDMWERTLVFKRFLLKICSWSLVWLPGFSSKGLKTVCTFFSQGNCFRPERSLPWQTCRKSDGRLLRSPWLRHGSSKCSPKDSYTPNTAVKAPSSHFK